MTADGPHRRGAVHHIELWVPNLDRSTRAWGWLLEALGYHPFQSWPHGRSWRLGDAYVVVERSPALSVAEHDRRRPGINHVAFHGGSRSDVDALVIEAVTHGWTVLFRDKHPFAGGADHYAAYLEDMDGYEVELVAG